MWFAYHSSNQCGTLTVTLGNGLYRCSDAAPELAASVVVDVDDDALDGADENTESVSACPANHLSMSVSGGGLPGVLCCGASPNHSSAWVNPGGARGDHRSKR